MRVSVFRGRRPEMFLKIFIIEIKEKFLKGSWFGFSIVVGLY